MISCGAYAERKTNKREAHGGARGGTFREEGVVVVGLEEEAGGRRKQGRGLPLPDAKE